MPAVAGEHIIETLFLPITTVRSTIIKPLWSFSIPINQRNVFSLIGSLSLSVRDSQITFSNLYFLLILCQGLLCLSFCSLSRRFIAHGQPFPCSQSVRILHKLQQTCFLVTWYLRYYTQFSIRFPGQVSRLCFRLFHTISSSFRGIQLSKIILQSDTATTAV